jgi:hypothetical protein
LSLKDERMPQWILVCKQQSCSRDFLYRGTDSLHPMQTAYAVEPNKPRIPLHGVSKTCPHCNTLSQYYGANLALV